MTDQVCVLEVLVALQLLGGHGSWWGWGGCSRQGPAARGSPGPWRLAGSSRSPSAPLPRPQVLWGPVASSSFPLLLLPGPADLALKGLRPDPTAQTTRQQASQQLPVPGVGAGFRD